MKGLNENQMNIMAKFVASEIDKREKEIRWAKDKQKAEIKSTGCYILSMILAVFCFIFLCVSLLTILMFLNGVEIDNNWMSKSLCVIGWLSITALLYFLAKRFLEWGI